LEEVSGFKKLQWINFAFGAKKGGGELVASERMAMECFGLGSCAAVVAGASACELGKGSRLGVGFGRFCGGKETDMKLCWDGNYVAGAVVRAGKGGGGGGGGGAAASGEVDLVLKEKEAKLWGGRFEESVTPAVERFGQSVSYDWKLYKHDLMGSRAHANMLAKQVRLCLSLPLSLSLAFEQQ
jgi:hypothetical protein